MRTLVQAPTIMVCVNRSVSCNVTPVKLYVLSQFALRSFAHHFPQQLEPTWSAYFYTAHAHVHVNNLHGFLEVCLQRFDLSSLRLGNNAFLVASGVMVSGAPVLTYITSVFSSFTDTSTLIGLQYRSPSLFCHYCMLTSESDVFGVSSWTWYVLE